MFSIVHLSANLSKQNRFAVNKIFIQILAYVPYFSTFNSLIGCIWYICTISALNSRIVLKDITMCFLSGTHHFDKIEFARILKMLVWGEEMKIFIFIVFSVWKIVWIQTLSTQLFEKYSWKLLTNICDQIQWNQFFRSKVSLIKKFTLIKFKNGTSINVAWERHDKKMKSLTQISTCHLGSMSMDHSQQDKMTEVLLAISFQSMSNYQGS